MQVIKHRNAGDALIAALTLNEIWVEVRDPQPAHRPLVEEKRFYTRRKAANWIKRQKRFDRWNVYIIVIRKG